MNADGNLFDNSGILYYTPRMNEPLGANRVSSRPTQAMPCRIARGRACPPASVNGSTYIYFAWRRFTPAEG